MRPEDIILAQQDRIGSLELSKEKLIEQVKSLRCCGNCSFLLETAFDIECCLCDEDHEPGSVPASHCCDKWEHHK